MTNSEKMLSQMDELKKTYEDNLTIQEQYIKQIVEKIQGLTHAVNKLISLQENQIFFENKETVSEFLVIEDVRDLLSMPIPTIRYHIIHNYLPCYKKTRPIRFKKSEVLQWFENFASQSKEKVSPSEIIYMNDVCQLLGMPPETIRYHMKHSNLPCLPNIKPLSFNKSDILNWFKNYLPELDSSEELQ